MAFLIYIGGPTLSFL